MSLLKQYIFFKFCFPWSARLYKYQDSRVNATNCLPQDLTSRVYFLLQQHVKVKNKCLITIDFFTKLFVLIVISNSNVGFGGFTFVRIR